jgi:predicted N-acetyltransferase YhbS
VVDDEVTLRTATPGDRDSILVVVRDAFANSGRDGQEEVEIVRSTWSCGVPGGFDLVAEQGGEVVGHLLAACGELDGRRALAIAPLAVTPSRQGTGIGGALVTELLRRAEDAAAPLVLLLGSPAYYGRFGFEPSGPLGIVYPPVGGGSPHFQARRLRRYDPTWRGEFMYCWEATTC